MKTIKLTLLTALASTLLWSCGSPNDGKEEVISPEVVNNNASADPAATSSGGLPVFEFETDNHEFGVITEGEKVSYTFKFKNTGNAPLVISNASASCGCTVPEYTKTPVAPGEEGEVNVTFDSSGKSGMTTKSITLIANTEPNTKVLKVSADIQSKKQQP